MAGVPPVDPQELGASLRGALHRHWGLFLTEGIILVVLGIFAILIPQVASIAATILFGWLLLISGVAGLFFTLRARHAPGFVWSLISALTGIIAGAVLLVWPLQGTLTLTAVLIAFLVAEGVVSIFYALEHRNGLSGRWGWMLASGLIDLCLAALIFSGLPAAAFWALGLIIGVNLLFGGWALIAMALHARQPT